MAYIAPLHINPKAMFAPLNGKFYTNRDADRCFAQQPLPLIPDYLWVNKTVKHKPPTLYFGCMIVKRKLLNIVLQHFPHCVVWVTDDAQDSDSETEDESEAGKSVYGRNKEGLVPHEFSTLLCDSLADALAERFNLPGSGVLRVQIFATSEGRTKFGISFGSNETGLVPQRYRPAILEFFGFKSDEKPQWHLHPLRWRWTRMSASGNSS